MILPLSSCYLIGVFLSCCWGIELRAFLRVTDAESTAIGHACIQSKTSSVFLFEVSALTFIENSGFKMEIE